MYLAFFFSMCMTRCCCVHFYCCVCGIVDSRVVAFFWVCRRWQLKNISVSLTTITVLKLLRSIFPRAYVKLRVIFF